MKKLNSLWVVASLALLSAACGKKPTDDSLNSDLALASQAQQSMPPQVTSPAEQGLAANPYVAPVRRAPTASRASTPTVRRTSSTSRSTGRSTGTDVVYAPAPAPAPQTVKHTGRDAAIGAATGAVIGAVSSRDKVKGGLIGAAAGAILGGVIGNNVDVGKKY